MSLTARPPVRRAARAVATLINRALSPAGLRVTRSHDWSDTAAFIPLQATLDAARGAGLSVGDYVEAELNKVPGTSARTIGLMESAGVFEVPPRRIVEVGPGTGRYLDKILARCADSARAGNYEIYETATPWADYLVETFDVVSRPTGGYDLAATATGSVDLAHAHKVFSSVPFMVTCCYWQEFVRVVRPGGWVVFDIMTQRCLPPAQLRAWAASGIRNGAYPAVVPEDLAVDFFEDAGFALVASELIDMPPGLTEVMVFRRGDASGGSGAQPQRRQ